MGHLILVGLLLLSTGINNCLGKPVLSCPRDERGNEMIAGFSIDGLNTCICGKKPGDQRVGFACTLIGSTLIGPNWEEGDCVRDYYTDPCNFCKCVEGRGQCTKKNCPYTFGYRT